ncbi:ankyrin repeat-containing domain protein [Pelagophyceae sp. CCMP2097]|nr:ankyrin repeat-containing domain protein [Pelagophyceae sp. CCMP2097]|mmetsp:Transcript_34490/g.120369  ORF Transcript_34490/g.120369 Transcript_34490/m.120369 type:complete len:578 (-) Transcript_34490:34-1767(-)
MGAGASVPQPNEGPIRVGHLRGLPEAMDTALFLRERWPLVVDPREQASRFLRYQRGSFLIASSKRDMEPEHLRQLLVGCLQRGSMMTLCFETLRGVDVEALFAEGSFPRCVLDKQALFRDEAWAQLLRPELGDPQPHEFVPRDEFCLCVVVRDAAGVDELAGDFAAAFCRIDLATGDAPAASAESDEVEAVLGAKEVRRHSTDLVETAFEGDLAEVEAWIEKGFYVDSADSRKHTALSDAASAGHAEVCAVLLNLGADPNSKSDVGRTPVWRAAYNGHSAMVRLLLEAGADPTVVTHDFERPFDVAKDDATRALLQEWPAEATARLHAQRAEKVAAELEARLKTAAAREAYARDAFAAELVQLAEAGDADAVKVQLERLAADAVQTGERPRATASTARDDRGATLVHIAAQRGHMALLDLLLTHHARLCEGQSVLSEPSAEAKVFFTNVNRRDAKGWSPIAVAVFHDQKHAARLLLDHGADPELVNQYGHSAFKLAQDSIASEERTVLRDKSEVRAVLEEWDTQRRSRLFGTGAHGIPAARREEALPKDGTAMAMDVEMHADRAAAEAKPKKKGASK